jgi:peptidoglycan hydrolase CwlO-like protein
MKTTTYRTNADLDRFVSALRDLQGQLDELQAQGRAQVAIMNAVQQSTALEGTASAVLTESEARYEAVGRAFAREAKHMLGEDARPGETFDQFAERITATDPLEHMTRNGIVFLGGSS